MAYEFKTTPFTHQREALNTKRAWLSDAFFWRMEMGTGKTKVALDNAGALFERDLIDGLLVVAPKTVCRNWTGIEIPAHLPDRIERTVLLWKPKSARPAAWKDKVAGLHKAPGLAVYVVNVEALAFPDGRKDIEAFLRARRVLWVIDESTTIKNPQAKRTKAALKLAPLAPYRRIMSGHPITRDPLDLWGQCEFLRHGILGDTSFWSFRARYAILRELRIGGRSFQKVEGFRGLDQLRQILASFSYAVTKAECLDLPPKVYAVRHVDMTPEQKRVYTSMRDQFEAEVVQGSACTATNILARIMRLQQILSGYLPTDDGKAHEIPTNRLSALLEVLDEAEGKAIVWAPFRRDVERVRAAIAEVYGKGSVVVLHGDVSADDRATAIKAFQEHPEVRYIVGTPHTGGIGVTLTAASCVVYYANTWDLGIRAQSEDRAHRIGQRSTVTYVDLVTPTTVDETILQALRSKRTLAEMVTATTPEEIAKWA